MTDDDVPIPGIPPMPDDWHPCAVENPNSESQMKVCEFPEDHDGEHSWELEPPPPPPKVSTRVPLTVHGFRIGSDSAKIADILIAGGLDRQDINERVLEVIDPVSSGGKPKNVPSLISGLLARLEKKGYYIESSWRVVPPPAVKRKMKRQQ